MTEQKHEQNTPFGFSTFSLAVDFSLPNVAVNSAESSTLASLIVNLWMVPSTVNTARLSDFRIFLPLRDQVTGCLGLETSHSKTAVSPSGMVISLSGVRNVKAASGIQELSHRIRNGKDEM